MTECARVCRQTLTYCLEQGGDHAEPEHVKGLVDCADLCTWAATLHDRQSPQAQGLMELCAEACEACQESCEQFGDDKTMQDCAAACEACADHCRSL